MSESKPLLQVSDVEKTFVTGPEELTVLRRVSLLMNDGEVLVITGESGSGKTTLLSLIAGLDLPTHGTIECAGYEVSRLNEAGLTEYRAHRVGLIFQLHYLLKDFTALENVMIPAYMAGVPKQDALRRAHLLLEQVNLDGRAGHYPRELSGGERQRVAVARSLVNAPDLILADEPTGNLDSRSTEEVLRIFARLNLEGRTVVLITHEPDVAEQAKRVVHLIDGEIDRDERRCGVEDPPPALGRQKSAHQPEGAAAEPGKQR